jgi:protein-S-isoprenylcysteine O-methyltransferase Ste14
MIKKTIIKTILRTIQSLVFILALVWIYAPIVAWMLFLMAVWVVPLAFTSYHLFAFLGQLEWFGNLIRLRDLGYTPGVKALLIFEILIIIIGLILFIGGLVHISVIKLRKEGLATTGLYKYIRHPQHLGLILISFAFSLFIPETYDLGIYVAEIMSWSLFSLVLFLWSDLEERQLFKKFGDEFVEYRNTTGAFFPRIFNREKKKKNFSEIKYWKRYILTVSIYLSFILFMYILSLPSLGIFIPTV